MGTPNVHTKDRWSMKILLALLMAVGGVFFAVLAGTGLALLITRTYHYLEYSAIVTCVSTLVSWTLLRAARTRLHRRNW